ncbi:MAG: septum formation initiator family protein [Nitriliruptoraceae bacterium]
MFRGDRPLVAMTLVIAALGMSLLVGPAQQYFDERSRVDLLRATASRLDTEVQRLDQRVADLHDPEHIEILAREQHGLVREGEVAYSIVPPERSESSVGPSMDMVAASPDESHDAGEDAWYARLWQWVGGWIGGAS